MRMPARSKERNLSNENDWFYFAKSTIAAILAIGLLSSAAGVDAQQKVYKWVDEDGVVHFSDEPPDESSEFEVEAITTEPAPPHTPAPRTQIKSPSPSARKVEQPAQPEARTPPPAEEVDITAMSLAELDRRCEAAREEKIAPLRAAEIANCIKTETGDQDWCEVFWADYGDPVLTVSGTLTPRMFHDLPECIEALDERHRRVSQ